MSSRDVYYRGGRFISWKRREIYQPGSAASGVSTARIGLFWQTSRRTRDAHPVLFQCWSSVPNIETAPGGRPAGPGCRMVHVTATGAETTPRSWRKKTQPPCIASGRTTRAMFVLHEGRGSASCSLISPPPPPPPTANPNSSGLPGAAVTCVAVIHLYSVCLDQNAVSPDQDPGARQSKRIVFTSEVKSQKTSEKMSFAAWYATAVLSQKTVCAYFTSKHILPFGFVKQNRERCTIDVELLSVVLFFKIFTHLKLWIALARHNFKWVKILWKPLWPILLCKPKDSMCSLVK